MSKPLELLEKFRIAASETDLPRIKKSLPRMKRGVIAKAWERVESLWKAASDGSAPWEQRALAIGALLYLISPVDAVPDPIPVFGLLDDLVVITFAIKVIVNEIAKAAVTVLEQKAAIAFKVEIRKMVVMVVGAILISYIWLLVRPFWTPS